MESLTIGKTLNQHKDMRSLAFDPPDGFIGKNIFPDPVTNPGM